MCKTCDKRYLGVGAITHNRFYLVCFGQNKMSWPKTILVRIEFLATLNGC